MNNADVQHALLLCVPHMIFYVHLHELEIHAIWNSHKSLKMNMLTTRHTSQAETDLPA